MLICSFCEAANEEAAGVCGSCGELIVTESTRKRVSRTERAGEITTNFAPKIHAPNTALRIFIMAVLGFGLAGYWLVAPMLRSPQASLMGQTALQTANQQNNGMLTAESLAAITENSRKASGCGHVHIWLVPAPDTGGSGSGLTGGGSQQSAEQLVSQYIQTTFKPQEMASATADQGQTIVVAAAWACS